MINASKYCLLVFLPLWLWSADITAQVAGHHDLQFCATPPEKDERLIYYQQNLNSYRFLSDETLYVPLKIHIVGRDDGTGYANIDYVMQAFCIMNQNFEESGIRFFIKGDINYIDNSEWRNHTSFGPGGEMILSNNVPGALNSYIVDVAAGACGYYSPSVDGVVLAINCLDPVNQTWAHEIGHQLTLPHTFFGWEGTTYEHGEPAPERLWFRGRWVDVETIDGSNCRDAGDGFCDTPPDYLSSRWGCTASNPLGIFLIDPLGQQERVDGSNIMSYSSGACRSSFSGEQIQAMRMNILLDRPDLANDNVSFGPVTSEIEFVSPLQDEEVQYNNADLQWRSVPNATYYRVQVSALPIFANLLVDEIVRDTFLQLPELILGREHLVRIKPLSEFQPCNDYSQRLAFMASEVSSVDISVENKMEVTIPNPISVNSPIVISIVGENTNRNDLKIQIVDINGRILHERKEHLFSGNSLSIETTGLSAGVYFVNINSDESAPIVRKIALF